MGQFFINLNFNKLEQKILKVLGKSESPVKFNVLFNRLGVYQSQRRAVRTILQEMVRKGSIVKNGKYYQKAEEKKINEPLPADSEFGNLTVVGKFDKHKLSYIVIPDSRKIKKDIYIDFKNKGKAKFGDKVIVEILNPEDIESEYIDIEGKVIQIIGRAGNKKVELDSILHKYGFQRHFSKEIENESKKIESEINLSDSLKNREDLRDITCFTIDPEDSKDFDDAVSIKKTPEGYLLGVHIADVSHYVKENSIIDSEAFRRGTSVYLVDTVAPMLPENLSNDICSLKPLTDRLTFSVFISISKDLKILDYKIFKSIIKSKRRFTYEEVQEIIKTKKGDSSKDILLMYKLSQSLTNQRLKAGSIDFDSKEVKFVVNDKGDIIDIKIKQRLDSMRLVEEFMLLANKCVTIYVTELSKKTLIQYPFIFRIHDDPDKDKLKELSIFIKQFGYRTNLKDKNAIKKLLDDIKGKPEEYIINNLVLRAMAKAIYKEENIGHYGLGFDDYTHFTSPIRRYPDLIVHRILNDYLSGGKNLKKRIDYYRNVLPGICKQSSVQEQSAVNAERDTIKIKQSEFLSERIGEEYTGIISGIVRYGMFVELEKYMIEGMVRFRDISNDYYEYDERTHCAVGVRKKKMFRAGQKVKVKIIDTNIETRKIDFVLV